MWRNPERLSCSGRVEVSVYYQVNMPPPFFMMGLFVSSRHRVIGFYIKVKLAHEIHPIVELLDSPIVLVVTYCLLFIQRTPI